MLTAMFAIFGEAEWVARLLPITFSFLGVVLLWLLVKDCTNPRTAAFVVLAFAAMPMVLRYGRMVNFEPANLVWMLAVMLGLRGWMKGDPRWRWLIIAAATLGMWTAWLGYLFILTLCLHLRLAIPDWRRLTGSLFLAMGLSLVLFALQIKLARPDAWHDLFAAMSYRMAGGGHAIGWRDWSVRIGGSLLAHIQPVFWLLGLAGAVLAGKSPRGGSLRWLGWSASCFFAMNTLYVVLFRNASAIHDYASFYFTVPVAMMTGVALDGVFRWCESRGVLLRIVAAASASLLLGFLAVLGQRETVELRRPFRILSDENPEPPELIPELGKAIRDRFGDDVAVICNFLPSYGPQLHYYARHELLSSVFTAAEWAEVIADPQNAPVGGVVWLGDPRSQEIVARLPPGPRESVTIRNISFCFWHPAEASPTVQAGQSDWIRGGDLP
jgi:hypothetical protein